ncbi:N-acetylmuramic acid 6-phosphate etherase [Antarcticirhabdus aurantiaca]|uniref:N-acetylmuramic acid 6-phosphate etherase n=1 Tax=Antarcticirhabdus aurantiaca TaxID=2606717 RepID=A0ACD4NQK9_9HYPH|nr:N-acetylmuramic acid 6-phosphate etherase [Antarcticirhabdus aurantiaca]WAJ29159.1 N-acetylmuramic acid 6-phosphate etherase [Jeongeuplla avenae]
MAAGIETRATERSEARNERLDALEPGALLEALLDGQAAAVAAVRAALPAIEAARAPALERLRRPASRLAYAGAGTSGRLAMLDGVELGPTFDWPAERLVVILAGGEASIAQAREGAEDDREAAARAVEANALGPNDVLVALAASGGTPFTLAAVETARSRGALTIGLANNPGSPLLQAAQCPVLLDTGPEVLAGSTRLAAGTAQKIALNLLSTALMVGLGKVYRGRMVDMRPTNAKLQARAVAMVQDLVPCDEPAARAALNATGFRVKPAILVARGLSSDEADRRLAAAGGSLRAALAESG